MEDLAACFGARCGPSEGRLLFGLGCACVRPLLAQTAPIDVGSGSGRRVAAYDLEVGLDPAAALLRLPPYAAFRPWAELPTPLQEQPVRPYGILATGTVLADGAWDRWCEDKGRGGHPFCRAVHVLSPAEQFGLLGRV